MAEQNLTLGHDEIAEEWRRGLREGMRSRNAEDFGGLKVWRVDNNVILSDGGWNDYPVSCKNEAEAVMEFQRIVNGLNNRQTVRELLPDADLPIEIETAWVH